VVNNDDATRRHCRIGGSADPLAFAQASGHMRACTWTWTCAPRHHLFHTYPLVPVGGRTFPPLSVRYSSIRPEYICPLTSSKKELDGAGLLWADAALRFVDLVRLIHVDRPHLREGTADTIHATVHTEFALWSLLMLKICDFSSSFLVALYHCGNNVQFSPFQQPLNYTDSLDFL
jgi:hypothetical protein